MLVNFLLRRLLRFGYGSFVNSRGGLVLLQRTVQRTTLDDATRVSYIYIYRQNLSVDMSLPFEGRQTLLSIRKPQAALRRNKTVDSRDAARRSRILSG